MKVIVCGAGQVGYNITAYLSNEDNDITVIDSDPELIAQINDNLDANGIVGFPSYPDKLVEAGIKNANMIIAVTESDEVNMIACQVAHSLFGVPKKIARIRTTNYLDPGYANLFARAHMPIDVIISPEIEVADAILRRVTVPGTSDIVPMAGGDMMLVGVHCEENCPVVNTPLRQLRTLFPDLQAQILAIIRGKERIIAQQDNQMLIGDEVYYIVSKDHLYRSLAAFGHEEPKARHVVIMGGGSVGTSLALKVLDTLHNIDVKIIEFNPDKAFDVAKKIPKATVIKGDGLDKGILEEAHIEHSEAFIAVTDDDETNLLASLLAKQYGCTRTMTLINKSLYTDVAPGLGIDAIISPRGITVSTILQHVRKGRIKGVHNIYDGFAEVMEVEVSPNSSILNKQIGELYLEKDVKFGAIIRDGEIIIPDGSHILKNGDTAIIISPQKHARSIEKMFSAKVDIVGL